MSSTQQKIPIITSDYIISLHTMLENLTVKVEQLGTHLEKIVIPEPLQTTPAPAKFEVSLSFLAAATGKSKSTIERRIDEKKLPKPHVNPDNRYRFWYKSDLPSSLYEQIDAKYHESIKASR